MACCKLHHDATAAHRRVTGTAETFGPNELREQSDFLDACMATPCMQYAHQWLSSRQLIGAPCHSPAQLRCSRISDHALLLCLEVDAVT
jgi:hypothetical protein